MSDERAPDFAMHRAVEILAGIYEKHQAAREGPAPPLDRPAAIACADLVLQVGTTTRAQVERAWGVAFAYPMRGWHTYAAREDGGRRFLSLFYADAVLVAAEYYVPRASGAPALAPRDLGPVRLTPGDVGIGDALALPFEQRFPGGLAFVQERDGRVDRIGLYAGT